MNTIAFDRKNFFDEYKAAFYPAHTGLEGLLQKETVLSLNQILTWIEEDGLEFYETKEALIYCLATWYWESGRYYKRLIGGNYRNVRIEFQSIEEKRANPKTQPALYKNQERYFKTNTQGRGLVMVTWPENYHKIGELDGIKGITVKDFTNDWTISGGVLTAKPYLMLDERLSYLAASRGMKEGVFTGKRLKTYFKQGTPPLYVPARDIVNGKRDKAELIAGFAGKFERIVRVSLFNGGVPQLLPLLNVVAPPPVAPAPPPPPPPDNTLIVLPAHPEYIKLPPPTTQELLTHLNIEPKPNPLEEADEEEIQQKLFNESVNNTRFENVYDLFNEYFGNNQIFNQADESDKNSTNKTPAQPTRLKGWQVAAIGFIITNAAAIFAYIGQLPQGVQASIYVSGGVVTSVLVFSVIWLKNEREKRAAMEDLEKLKANLNVNPLG